MGHTEFLYTQYLNHPVICTDTRAISEGCMFFALKGDNFDANSFAQQALASGAAIAIVDDPKYTGTANMYVVPDVLGALQDLARQHRSQLHIPIIGLTGSNGKTTTKELINAVLAEKYKTYATKGNLNNHIGVPLTLLSIGKDVEIAVVEMGANHQKEIEFLCSIAQPTHGLITNVGMAHLDGFGGFEGVKKGKAELYAHLKQSGGIPFINRNNPYLMEMSTVAALNNIVYYGTDPANNVSGTLIQSDPYLEISWLHGSEYARAVTHLTGSYNFENMLAAVCIGYFFELTTPQIKAGITGYVPKNNRSQLSKTESNTVICDFYNANPSSMIAAIDNLNAISADRKVAILGDMFELGPESAAQHQLIVTHANENAPDLLIFIGKHFKASAGKGNNLFFESPADAEAWLKSNPVKDSLILLKGSRGMALEKLLPAL
ncbi:MAG: UDP-N-acetylmuramoyl-tripeptide--D-alanyl-D-alanine ligase [Pedobacter sp.]|nr:MAG: UDP-N-acetylmuramoyl-tripeptide--D-alanyl-D-alanine ligase [Pedobacter sp.]